MTLSLQICPKKTVMYPALAELVAILRLYTARHLKLKTDSSEVHIFSDSQPAIGILQFEWQQTQHKQTVAEIRPNSVKKTPEKTKRLLQHFKYVKSTSNYNSLHIKIFRC